MMPLTIQITLINGTLGGFFLVKFQWFIFCPKGERVKFVILSSVYIQTQYCNAPTSYIVGWPALAQSVERWVFKLKGPEFESSSDPSSCSMSQKVPNSRRIYVLCIRSSIITKWFSADRNLFQGVMGEVNHLNQSNPLMFLSINAWKKATAFWLFSSLDKFLN